MPTTSTVSTSPLIYTPGEEITVTLNASQNTGITWLMLKVDYDETALEAVEDKCSTSQLFTAADEITQYNGYMKFFSNSSRPTEATGVFATLTFVVKEACAKDTSIVVTTFNNSAGNCICDYGYGDYDEIPFESESNTFAIHDIDKDAGVVTAPTCTEEGYTTYACGACSEAVVGNIVDATGHSPAAAVEENRVEPTCTVVGSYDSVVYCGVCNTELSRTPNTIDATGHTAGTAVEENRVEPTCTVAGSYDSVVYCTVCKTELSRTPNTIPATGHTAGTAVEENRKEPTCTDKGSYDSVVYCTVCKTELSREAKSIDALGHDLKHTDAKAPTCTEIGWDAYDMCQRANCGHTTYKELPAAGHTYGETTVIEPEYKKEGYSVHTCTVCQYEEKFDVNAALTYILGDVNGNEKIDSDDAIHLLYYTLLPESNPINQKGDFNGDGSVNSDDAIHLLYYTLLPDQYPLSK